MRAALLPVFVGGCALCVGWAVPSVAASPPLSRPADVAAALEADLAQARAARQQGDRYAALRAYGEARRKQPHHPEAVQGIADLLAELGAPYGAAAVLGQADLGLRSRQAGLLVRWGTTIHPRDPARRFDTTDAALAQLDALLAEAQRLDPPDTGLLHRLRGDRIVALRDRERWVEVLTASAALRADAGRLPVYVAHAEADALLANRQPEAARTAYQAVLDQYPPSDPAHRQALQGRLYAEVEAEDFAAAFQTADALAAEGQAARYVGHDPSPQPNTEWLDAQIVAAQVRSYADMQADAWARLAPLAQGAPALAYLRSAQGGVAAGRGWPRRAEAEAEVAYGLAPDDFGMQLGLADADVRRRRWEGAAARLDALAAIAPHDAAVRRSQTELAAYRRAELIVEWAARREKGGALSAPGGGMDSSVRLYSPPIAERWRLTTLAMQATAKPIEGQVVRNRFGAGVEGRWPDATLAAELYTGSGISSRAGASLSGQWQPNDFLTMHADVQRFGWETPLRALHYGITADSVGASLAYAWHESRVASLGLRQARFSDGNHRVQLSADIAQKIIDRPHFDLTIRPAFYTSRNSLADAPYFNPPQDRALSLTLEAQHLLSRFYERSWRQQMAVTLGAYQQAQHRSEWTASARYAHVHALAPFTEFQYGVQWSRAVYDGEAERGLGLFMRLQHRF